MALLQNKRYDVYFMVNSYYSSGDEESLERCEDEISICQRKSNEQARKRNDLQKKINELREQLATAEVNFIS